MQKIQLKFTHSIPNPEKASLLSFSFDPNNPILSLLWSDGTWEGFEYSPQYLNTDSHIDPKKKFSRKLGAFKIGESKAIQSTSLSPSVSVIFGQKKDSTGYLLTAWNDLYGTIYGSLDINDLESDHEVLGIISPKDGNSVVVVLSRTVVVCPMYCPPPTLASALGKMKVTAPLLAKESQPVPLAPFCHDVQDLDFLFIKRRVSHYNVAGVAPDPKYPWESPSGFDKKLRPF